MGWVFFRIRWLNEAFIESGSKLVFNVALPSLLFLSISQSNFSNAANFTLITIGISGSVLMCAVLMPVSYTHLTLPTIYSV